MTANIKTKRIGVLAGGPSSEREISLKSGTAVHKALVDEGFNAIFLDIKDDICDIIKKNRIDVAFIALHGKFGEDGTVQKMLEEMGIPYTGSGVEASRIALDKIASKEIFVREGIPVPAYAVLEKGAPVTDDVLSLGWPIVVKPPLEGSSIGLSIVWDMAGLDAALEKAYKFGPKVLIEEYIDGRELTVGILNDKPLPVIEIVPKNKVYDYEAKYKSPDTEYLVPAPVDKETFEKAQRLGERAHKALGCRCMSRVDIMAGKDGKLYVLEVNTIPGMTERSLLPKAAGAVGLSFGKLCMRLIESAHG
jgi:D-alanine-D-alanine ligase